ncbi:helix-turn-helix domain-containing protein [Amycolatopsis aidingensis]|uniref:helix-turn-helix domain-containing protein n=1 Tax=Amycolatopsis aidingensis TaxID=2842453 RepID=UPI001C0D2362|nr:helix-turn-helix domain-containing protein [Amycolatopsis aidingensis]
MDTTRSAPRHPARRAGSARHVSEPPTGPLSARPDSPGPSTPATRPTGHRGHRREPNRHPKPDTARSGQQGSAIPDLEHLTSHTRADATPPPPWSREGLYALGVTTDLLTAARVLRIGRTKAYQLARSGDFPVPTTRIGRRYVVAVAHLVEFLGLDERASS